MVPKTEKCKRIRKKLETYSELSKLVREMDKSVDAVVVEGKHDEETLRKLGFRGRIFTYSSSRMRRQDFIEFLAERFEYISILTDFDEDGELFCKELSKELERRGAKVERVFREKIRELLKPFKIKTIESIYKLAL
jgi:5S rRNA maturation endonuclease (ribonuclease M5)